MSSYIFDRYGILLNDIEQARERLEALLGVRFERRDSMYKGGDYYLSGVSNTKGIVIQKNFIDFTSSYVEPSRPDLKLVMSVNRLESADAIRSVAKGAPDVLVFISRDVIEKPQS